MPGLKTPSLAGEDDARRARGNVLQIHRDQGLPEGTGVHDLLARAHQAAAQAQVPRLPPGLATSVWVVEARR